jgi:carotenoid cleavage dioxygenase-like enzyme
MIAGEQAPPAKAALEGPLAALDWSGRFRDQARRQAWLAAYGELPPGLVAMQCETVPVQGEMPPRLQGKLRRILAARHEVGGLRYHHWWDGDGMLAEFTIAAGRVSHRARYIDTIKYQAERRAGRAVYEQFGTRLPTLVRPADIDDMNPANVNVLWHDGELLALGDWCSAWRIDPDTLRGLGRKVWSEDTAGAPFSAHPRKDAQGVLWSIGYAPWKGLLHLYGIGPDSGRVRTRTLELGQFGLVHDFIVTDHWLVVPLTSTVWSRERDAAGHSMLDCLEWRPDVPVRVLIIDKHDFSVARTLELPAGMIYHYGNGFETADGGIRLHACWFSDASYMLTTFRAVMRGELAMGPPPIQMLIDIPRTGSARMQQIGGIGELPRVDERLMGQPFRQVWLGAPGAPPGPPTKFGFSAWMRLDLDSAATESFDFGPQVIAEEPAFAPRPDAGDEADGWLVGTVFDIPSGRTLLHVFDAMHLADGPIATATLPYAQPIGVHGNFHAS